MNFYAPYVPLQVTTVIASVESTPARAGRVTRMNWSSEAAEDLRAFHGQSWKTEPTTSPPVKLVHACGNEVCLICEISLQSTPAVSFTNDPDTGLYL